MLILEIGIANTSPNILNDGLWLDSIHANFIRKELLVKQKLSLRVNNLSGIIQNQTLEINTLSSKSSNNIIQLEEQKLFYKDKLKKEKGNKFLILVLSILGAGAVGFIAGVVTTN